MNENTSKPEQLLWAANAAGRAGDYVGENIAEIGDDLIKTVYRHSMRR